VTTLSDRPAEPHPAQREPRPVTPPSRHTDAWRALLAESPHRSAVAELAADGAAHLLVVVAHPDDETLAMGATLAACAAAGAEVSLLVLTCGEAALDHVGERPVGLGARRRAELVRAAEQLGARHLSCLGLPDSRLAEHAEEALHAARTVTAGLTPTRVLTTWHRDPHPDHQAAARVAAALAGQRQLPVTELALWGPHWTDPAGLGDAGLVLLEHDAAARESRSRALSCYGSQLLPMHPGVGPVLPPDVLAWDLEVVVR
jgi:LmbE family N-acetylglucosaminyl deacetylase